MNKIENIQQAIAAIESAGFEIDKITNIEYAIYKSLPQTIDIGFGFWTKRPLVEVLYSDGLVEFARKCQLKAFW